MADFLEVFSDETKRGHKIQTSDYLPFGKYPIIDQGQEQVAGYTDRKEGLFCDVPAIVFGDHTRIIKYVDTPFFLGADGVKVLRCKIETANYKYLYYYLQSIKIPNTGYNRHFKWLKESTISILPLQEQLKIVSVLDKISELISLRKQQLAKLDELVKARFVEMFGEYPSNAKKWKTCAIRDIVTDVHYGTSRPAVDGGTYPYLRMNNITYSGELDLSDIKRIDIPENELPKCTVKRGDVLFNRTNSKELVGKTCVYDKDEMMVLAGFIIRVRVNKQILPEFLSEFLNTDFSKKMLLGMCKAAIGQANINAQELQNIRLYLPPVALQQSFADFKTSIDRQKLTIRRSLDKMEVLKKALMQKYFG